MIRVARRVVCLSAVVLTLVVAGRAQDQSASPAPADPRVGLKPGFHDAGVAARNLELVASLPKPKGFFDPAQPAGPPAGPERKFTPEELATLDQGRELPPDPKDKSATANGGARNPNGLGYANSDLAFQRADLFIGNFNGFNTYDIETPKKPRLLASVVCPGGQGDMSIHGNLLFMSVEQTRGRVDCGTQGVTDTVSKERFRGVRIFDISDITKPKQVAAVQTCRGSHTHTLVTDPNDKANIYVYGSGTSSVRSGDELEGCSSEGSQGGSEHRALQHRRDSGAARRSRKGPHRQPAADFCRCRDRRNRGAREGRRAGTWDAARARHQPVS
jgi:hypothetical protein